MKKISLLYIISLLAVLVIGTMYCSNVSKNNAYTTNSVVDLELGTKIGEPIVDTTEEVGGGATTVSEAPSNLNAIPDANDMLPEASLEGFFEKIYNKMFTGVTMLQKIIALVLALFFVFSVVMVVVSCLGQKSKVPWYLLSMLICALCFVADIYALPILNAFTNWFTN